MASQGHSVSVAWSHSAADEQAQAAVAIERRAFVMVFNGYLVANTNPIVPFTLTSILNLFEGFGWSAKKYDLGSILCPLHLQWLTVVRTCN